MRRHYQIDLPTAPFACLPKTVLVTAASSRALRNHVERFALYFLREMQTGGLQFEAAETQSETGFVEYKAFLISSQDRYVGAGCFRLRGDQNSALPWLFDWIWIHPYFRRRGVLSGIWPELCDEVGKFRLAEPLSLHMERFVQKSGLRGDD